MINEEQNLAVAVRGSTDAKQKKLCVRYVYSPAELFIRISIFFLVDNATASTSFNATLDIRFYFSPHNPKFPVHGGGQPYIHNNTFTVGKEEEEQMLIIIWKHHNQIRSDQIRSIRSDQIINSFKLLRC
jgi:hypothetical protein